MRATFKKSPSETSFCLPSFRLLFCGFDVKDVPRLGLAPLDFAGSSLAKALSRA